MIQVSRHKNVTGVERLGFSSSISSPGPAVVLFDFFPKFPPDRVHMGIERSGRGLRWELGPFEGAILKKFSYRG